MTTGPNPSTKTRRPDGAALVIALFLAGLAVLIFWDVSRLGDAAGYSQVGPATVPHWIASGLLILSAWTLFAAFRGGFPEREHQEIAPVIWIIAGLALQLLLLKPAGFSIATGILFAATAYAFGRKKLWISLPVGILFCLFVWAVFALVLQLSLPAGPLERLLL